MKEPRTLHPKLQAVLQTAEGLQQILGEHYEVIVHDLQHVESSIVAIYGNVTNREVGGPATNLLLQLLKNYGDEAPNKINYRSILPDGRVLRSSTLFIRDETDRILGSLCINQDLTDYVVASKLLQGLTNIRDGQQDQPAQEVFSRDINDVVESMVRSELEVLGKPVAYMQKEDKLTIVENLEQKGIFDVKGAVEYVAERLGVTNFTVYNYLKTVRCARR